jgi:hypothetical protein
MGLRFDGGFDHKVSVGSNAVLDQMTVGTVLCWCKLDSAPPGNDSRIWSKGATGLDTGLRFNNTGGATNLSHFVVRATTPLQVTTDNPPGVASGAWAFIASSWNTAGANGDQHLYSGSLSLVVAEVGSYVTRVVGSGALQENPAEPGILGNRGAGSRQFDGNIATVLIFSHQLSLGEIRAQQFHPHLVSGCVGFWHLGYAGTGTQPDWSGNGNHGTVTGATVGVHVPLDPPFGGDAAAPYAVAAAPAVNRIAMVV